MAVTYTIEARQKSACSSYLGGYFDCQGKTHFLTFSEDLVSVREVGGVCTPPALERRGFLGVDPVTGILHITQPADGKPYLQFDFRQERLLKHRSRLPEVLSSKLEKRAKLPKTFWQYTSMQRTQSYTVFIQDLSFGIDKNQPKHYTRVVAALVATASTNPSALTVVFPDNIGGELTNFAGCYETHAGSLRLCLWRQRIPLLTISYLDVCAFDTSATVLFRVPMPCELASYNVSILQWLYNGEFLLLGTFFCTPELNQLLREVWLFSRFDKRWQKVFQCAPTLDTYGMTFAILDPIADKAAVIVQDGTEENEFLVNFRGPGRRMSWAWAVYAACMRR